MIQLIKYEYKKLILKKNLIIIIILFSIFNVLNIKSVYEQNALFLKDMQGLDGLYWELYDDYSGEIKVEKIEKLLDIYIPLKEEVADLTASTRTDNPNTMTGNVYRDKSFIGELYVSPMKYFYMYKNVSKGIVGEAVNNMKFYSKHDNNYEYLKNRYVANLFMDRTIDYFAYIEMFDYYTYYDFSIFLIILLCIYITANVFIIEKETEMDNILITNRNGGRKTCIAKIITIISFITIISVYFLALDFIVFATLFRNVENSFMPIYSLKTYIYTPLNVNLWQYSIVSSLTKLVGIICATTIFLLVTMFFKNVLLPFVINLILSVLLIFLADVHIGSNYLLRKVLNPFVLLFNRELYMKTEFINIFGFPVLTYVFSISLTIVLILLILGLILFFSRKNIFNKKGVSL